MKEFVKPTFRLKLLDAETIPVPRPLCSSRLDFRKKNSLITVIKFHSGIYWYALPAARSLTLMWEISTKGSFLGGIDPIKLKVPLNAEKKKLLSALN